MSTPSTPSTPASDSRLQHIQQLQFTDRAAAEALLLTFIREVFPALDAVAVELRPLAVSLNSFNGFLTLRDGSRLFYKTHVEPGSVIDEYYNTTLLAQAGYPIIQPRYASTEYGKQFLIYDVIDSPSVFDVAHAIERAEHSESDDLAALTAAQNRADDELLDIYGRTLEMQDAESAGKAAVHQLFHHRLGARYQQFYVGKTIHLPGLSLPFEDMLRRIWVINEVVGGSLGEAVADARDLLLPAQPGPSIIGHGDAHNGNVFFMPSGLVYFDPAFGGRHHPLLDLAKPLFHNAFATWMYHPQEVAQTLQISVRDTGLALVVEHNYELSACRRMFFTSKIERVLRPLVRELRKRDQLDQDWRRKLKSALMCCPLLTMNLADSARFPPPITLLGLAFAAQMGARFSLADDKDLPVLDDALDTIAGEIA